ncbi:MAG: HAD-IB family hydrolase [Eubacteriales bacterium]|jgi:HAD superfamily hydrolase (TIGR01490 family)|nr:HAD-IB family hydrolase [Eubacteriales bacterium]MDD3198430.1 HAD-IB family hydrolase [Eubacteriales bacterium]MDD4683403.1 HAD-IB family hydrolase [Eubacteriales bacterium]
MSRCAAFFDVDGTITREGLISELFRKMVKYELIDETKWQFEVKPAFSKWNRRVGDYDHYLQKMVDVYLDTVKNTDSYLISYIARKVIDQNYDRVYTFTRDKIKWHREQGHLIIAISGSPIELVREMAKKYKMDDYKGTVYEIGENGTYNGKITPMWDSRSKREAVLEMAAKHNLNLDACFAYGDTAGDFTMLDLVGNPYAINPTRELLNKIMENGELRGRVNVIVERKDSTYQLDVNCINLI